MPYLSAILKTHIKDSADSTVGYLQDILIEAEPGIYNPLRFLLARGKKENQSLLIPYDCVATLGRDEITLKNIWSNIATTTPNDNSYIYLKRDILDQQIVDVEGVRVVRVNDLKLGLFENAMRVLGIDISFKGILRRLGLEWLDFFSLCAVHLIDWRKTQSVKKGILKLDTISKDLATLHPADLATIIEDLTVRRGSRIVGSLNAEAAAHVLEEVDPKTQQALIKYLGPEKAAGIIERMSIDEIVDLLQVLPREEARQFLSYVQGNKLKKIEKLINYPTDTAGGLMSTEYVSARPEWTVRETVEEIRKASPHLRSIIHVYITDADNHFRGSVSLRRLLLTPAEEKLKKIMHELPGRTTLKVNHRINNVIKIMTKYDLYTAAVLDQDHKLVGVVTIDDIMRHLVPDA